MATKKKASKKKVSKKTKKKAAKKSGKKSATKKKSGKSPKQKKVPGKGPEIDNIPEPHVGRRTILTAQVQIDLVRIIQAGNYAITACNYAGVSESTYYAWLKRGEEELIRLLDIETETGKIAKPAKKELIYMEFLEAIKRADAGSEVSAVMKIKSAFGDDWKAAMTFLERRFADRWRRKDRHEITDGDGNPVQVMVYLPDNKRDKM